MSGMIKKTLIILLITLTVSFAALYIFVTFAHTTDNGQGAGGYSLLAIQYLIAIFFYGLKAEDNQQKNYETDKKILLAYAKGKIISFKIRLVIVIGFGLALIIIHIVCWWFGVSYAMMHIDNQPPMRGIT